MKQTYRIFRIVLIIIILGISNGQNQGQDKAVYKIQVASFPQSYPPDQIQRDLNLANPLSVHFLNNRYKYCLGEFASFNEATQFLPNVNVPGAFVVRIPVAQTQTNVPETTPTTVATNPAQAVVQQPSKPVTQQVTETFYAIQVAASRSFIEPATIKRQAGTAQDVGYFTKDGWYKYYTGQYPTEQDATAAMNQMRLNGFVTQVTATREVVVQETTQPAVQTPVGQPIVTGESAQAINRDSLATKEASDLAAKEYYNEAIRKADSVYYQIGNLLVARKLYREASGIDPEKNYPRDQIREIDIRMKAEQSKGLFGKVKLITAFIVVIIVVMIIVLIITLFLRSSRKRTQKQTQTLSHEYQDAVTEYLFDERGVRPPILSQADTERKKQVLIDEIMQLYANLSGEISNKLRELYVDLGLDNESVQKTKSPQWHIRAKGFRELAQMNIRVVNDEIEKCLNSTNNVLRMEAQLALVRLNFDDPFFFLDKLEQTFTSWEQLHVYEMIQRYQISVPNFTRWINSRNESVVVFCLRMIRAFKQGDTYAQILPLLKSHSKEIREETIITLGELENPDVLPVLKEKFPGEEQSSKVLILKAMTKLPDESNIEFLRQVLEPSNELRLEAAEALARIESFGVRGIETILKRSDEDLQAVAKHILDTKIHRR